MEWITKIFDEGRDGNKFLSFTEQNFSCSIVRDSELVGYSID